MHDIPSPMVYAVRPILVKNSKNSRWNELLIQSNYLNLLRQNLRNWHTVYMAGDILATVRKTSEWFRIFLKTNNNHSYFLQILHDFLVGSFPHSKFWAVITWNEKEAVAISLTLWMGQNGVTIARSVLSINEGVAYSCFRAKFLQWLGHLYTCSMPRQKQVYDNLTANSPSNMAKVGGDWNVSINEYWGISQLKILRRSNLC